MEPVGDSIVFRTTVKKVEQKRRLRKSWKSGDNIESLWEELGWYILLDGSWEYLHVGYEEPVFKVGDKVNVTIRITEHANT